MSAPVLLGALLYGPWQAITPAQLVNPPPEPVLLKSQSFERVVIGQIEGCPIIENGKTVGWSMACQDKYKK